MEFNWADLDPNLPDWATTIVRIWNRQMRRWESMYCTNRSQSILHFGGVPEGDRIVLHQFEAHLGDGPVSYWIFHDMEEDTYSWKAETSGDRGTTFEPGSGRAQFLLCLGADPAQLYDRGAV